MTQTSLIKSKACVQKFIWKKHNKFKVPILFKKTVQNIK